MRLAIRKLTYAPEEPAPQPSAEVTKEFMMSAGNLRLEASLDKEVIEGEWEGVQSTSYCPLSSMLMLLSCSSRTHTASLCASKQYENK